MPPVCFKPRFTGAARADAAAEPRKIVRGTGQAGQTVLELRKLHLQFAFGAGGALRKDVEDQTCAVDDPDAQRAFQIFLLRRAHLSIHDGQIDFQRLTFEGQFLRLAAADKGRVIGVVQLLQDAANDDRPGGVRKAAEFIQAVLGVNGDQHDLFRLVHDAAGRDGFGHQCVALVDLLEPFGLRQASGLEGTFDVHRKMTVFKLSQEGCGHAGTEAVLHADGTHGVKTQQPQRLYIDAAQPCVSARMRMDAAKAREAVKISPQVHFRQSDLRDGAHGDFEDFSVSVEVDHDLAVNLSRKAHQQPQ